MKLLVVALFALAALAAVHAGSVEDDKHEFELYKMKFGKYYETYEKELNAFRAFRKNLEFIQSRNAAEAGSLHLGLNKFSDMTNEEFRQQYLGLKMNPKHGSDPDHLHVDNADVSVPSTMDWRQQGAVTQVKNQGQCGSCWSFSTTGSVEGAHFLSSGSLVSLSEQNLVDCSTSYGNEGCQGGLMDQAFEYIINNGGIDTESSYPYQAQGPLQCQYNAANSGATISSYKDIPSGSEQSLLTAAGTVGPISVAIDASHPSFQSYSGGVYYEPACSSQMLDHGVLVVGYGTYNGEAYWLVKNSWGADWGMSGYIMMARNRNNNCGIATQASYPIV